MARRCTTDQQGPNQRRLISALRAALEPAARQARLIETHISYVLLTGTTAYKIKKAVRLPFLDFTSLADRRFYCEQELRLNRRLAPSLYLDVVRITGTLDQPQIGGSGPILEYAVRMREFPQDALLGNLVKRDALTDDHIDRLAAIVARFHRAIARAGATAEFGAPDLILELALANFAELRLLPATSDQRAEIVALEAWTRNEHAAVARVLASRHESGFVRECHGDLHLGNVALVDGSPTIFDCIEFNDRMRWIDVINEVAFTAMDLEHCGRPGLARRFLNVYLEATGDYAGVAVLRFYLVYRAIVRAKVACLRAADLPAGSVRDANCREYCDYLALAGAYAAPRRPALIVMHGFAGCGKSTLSQALLEQIGAIRIRTDVERKRLQGLDVNMPTGSGVESGLYAPAATQGTYEVVRTLARQVVVSGHVAIVDAAFLRRWQRDLFRDLAGELAVPFVILDVSAGQEMLRDRVRARAERASDPSEADVAVLTHQLATDEPLTADERGDVVLCDGELPVDRAHAAVTLRGAIERIEAGRKPPQGRAEPNCRVYQPAASCRPARRS